MAQPVEHEDQKNANRQPECRGALVALARSLVRQYVVQTAEEFLRITKGRAQKKLHSLNGKKHCNDSLRIDIPILRTE